MIEVNGKRLLADLRALAEFGKTGQGVHRLALSEEDRRNVTLPWED